MSAVLAEAVAAEVRAEMGRRQLTQQAIADLLGYTRQSAARRITGEIPWNVNELGTLAAALGVPVSRFLRESSPERAS